MLGGCGNMNQTNANEGKEQNETTNAENQNSDNRLVRVQDYTGEGYTLRNGEKTDKIAQENKEEITAAVEKFFLEKYKTEVIVHNMVGAVDGATVFVESVGEPHFYTYAIVPIDVEQRKVLSDNVWSQEGQVENAIKTGLYAMIFQEEITKLENYLEETVDSKPIIGITQEALKSVRATGYSTTHYYASTMGNSLDFLFNEYMNNQEMSKLDWKTIIEQNPYSPDSILFTIYLYMEEEKSEPDEEIFNQIVTEIEEMDGIPKGAYSIILNDNMINKTTAVGAKDNSLERSYPNDIIKE